MTKKTFNVIFSLLLVVFSAEAMNKEKNDPDKVPVNSVEDFFAFRQTLGQTRRVRFDSGDGAPVQSQLNKAPVKPKPVEQSEKK